MGRFIGTLKVGAQSVFGPVFTFISRPICLVLLMVGGGALVVYAAVTVFLDACYKFQWVGPVRRAVLSEDGVCTVIANNPPWLLMSGLATVPALVLTWYWREKHKREDIEIAQQGQVTERFTRAIEQLGHKEFAIRIGGIFALERIMQDSPRDQGTIVDTLCAFVRLRSPDAAQSKEGILLSDMQAALSVVGRQSRRGAPPHRTPDLSGCHLAGADLRKSNLRHANLAGADARYVSFVLADMSGANLAEAKLVGADMKASILTGANLSGADLSYCELVGADLTGATLSGASLLQADLRGAILTDGQGLRSDMLSRAILDDTTVLPKDLEPQPGATKNVG